MTAFFGLPHSHVQASFVRWFIITSVRCFAERRSDLNPYHLGLMEYLRPTCVKHGYPCLLTADVIDARLTANNVLTIYYCAS